MQRALNHRTIGSAIVLWTALASQAIAAPITVWLEDAPPEERLTLRADRRTGGTEHLASPDLAFPPQPLTAADGEAIDALRATLKGAEARWEEFEVELELAREVQVALEAVTVLREDQDRFEVIEALLFQGAAAVRAFEPDTFPVEDAAAGFRAFAGEEVIPKPWMDAYALLATEEIRRTNLIDGTAWIDFLRYSAALEALAPATLEIDPAFGRVWIDGAPVPDDTTSVTLRPGRHWVHVVRDGVVSGRITVRLDPGQAMPMPRQLPADDVEAARGKVVLGSKAGLPDTVVTNLARLEKVHGDQVFLGTMDAGRMVLVPYSGGAELVDSRLVTVVLSAEIGGGAMLTPIFNEGETDIEKLAGIMHGGAGLELGISYFLIAAGADVAISPAHTISFGNRDETDNIAISVYPQPYGGLGFYALRPTGRKPTLAFLGHVSWNAPSHVAYGGRISVGAPVDSRLRWFRFTLGGSYGPQTLWNLQNDPRPMITGFLRVGMGARL